MFRGSRTRRQLFAPDRRLRQCAWLPKGRCSDSLYLRAWSPTEGLSAASSRPPTAGRTSHSHATANVLPKSARFPRSAREELPICLGPKQRTFDLPDSDVGEVHLAARCRCKLTLRDASDSAGIDWRVLSSIERGERTCRVSELETLASTYGDRPDRLIRAVTGDTRARAQLGLD